MLRRIVGVASALALAWAVLVWMTGGTTIAIAGLRISSTDPLRPLSRRRCSAAIYVFASGRQRVREDAALARRLATASPPRARRRCSLPRSASSPIAQSSCTASGADAYAYVTQADLLLAGTLTVPVPDRERGPVAGAALDVRPVRLRRRGARVRDCVRSGTGSSAAHGAVQSVGGHAALFLVVPITAALLVWSTFAIGRALGSSIVSGSARPGSPRPAPRS